MKSLVIHCKKRIIINKSSVRYLRNNTQIPCVVYGKKHKNIHFFIPEKQIQNIIFNLGTSVLVLEWADKKLITVLLQEIQYHPVSDVVLHADFYKIDTNKPFYLNIPINIVGKERGLSKGGNILFFLKQLKMKAFLYDFPDFLKIDMTSFGRGEKILIKNINLKKKKYTLLHNENIIFLDVKG